MAKQPVFFLAAGIMSLLIAMGIGRFAYTPILPLMQHDASFSNAAAGYLASSNYAGYLIGAMAAGMTPKHRRTAFFRLSLILSILTTALMGLTHSLSLWFAWRFLSGVASAFVFVLTASIVLDKLASSGKTNWSGIFYGGVGLGIFYTGLMVPVLSRSFGWEGAWIGLAATSVLLALLVWFWLKDEAVPVESIQASRNQPAMKPAHKKATSTDMPSEKWLPWLVAAYGCEGLGYIVTGTFIVSMAEKVPGFHGDATLVWVFVGLAAFPSCMLWSFLGKKWGWVRSLVLSMILQAIGILMPVLWNSPIGAAAGAFFFGATFMGITTLATTLARQISPEKSSRLIGFMTSIYAAGQMLGPAIAGVLTARTGNYHEALIGATGVVMAGACLLLIGIQFEKKRLEYQAQICD